MVYFKCVQINLQHSRSVALDLSQLIHYGHNIDIALIQEPYANKDGDSIIIKRLVRSTICPSPIMHIPLLSLPTAH